MCVCQCVIVFACGSPPDYSCVLLTTSRVVEEGGGGRRRMCVSVCLCPEVHTEIEIVAREKCAIVFSMGGR